MKRFLYAMLLQWKLDIRDKGIILTYYVVPLVFFFFMGGVFTSINPEAHKTLIESMTIFSITMGAFIGYPQPLSETFNSGIKKSYKVGGIPLWSVVLNNFISGFIHLFIVSIIIFIVGPIAFNASIPANIPLYFLVLAFFIITCITIGSVIGLTVKGTANLVMISQFVFLPSIMLSGIMFPSSMLPKFLQNIGKILPATWGCINLVNNDFSLKNLLPLAIIFAICFIICTFRVKALKSD